MLELLPIILGVLSELALIQLNRRLGQVNRVHGIAAIIVVSIISILTVITTNSIVYASLSAVFGSVLVSLAIADAETMEIWDGYHILILFLGVLAVLFTDSIPLWERIVGLLCISVPMLLLTIIVSGAFGLGDVLLMASGGFYLGWRLTLLSAFLAILAGGIWGAVLLLRKRVEKTDHFAFGPFLCAGMIVSILFGMNLIQIYIDIISFW